MKNMHADMSLPEIEPALNPHNKSKTKTVARMDV